MFAPYWKCTNFCDDNKVFPDMTARYTHQIRADFLLVSPKRSQDTKYNHDKEGHTKISKGLNYSFTAKFNFGWKDVIGVADRVCTVIE